MIFNLQSFIQSLQARCVLEFSFFVFFLKKGNTTYIFCWDPGQKPKSNHMLFFFFLNKLDIRFSFIWPCQHSMRDLSSLSRDQTPVPCNGSRILTTGPPGKFPYAFLMSEKPVKCTHHHPEWNKQRLFMALCSFRSHFTTRWVHVRLDLLPDKLWKLFVFHIFWFWIVDYEFWMCIIHTP